MFPTKLMLLTNIWRGYTHLTLRFTNICCKISTLAFPKTPQLISYLTMKDCFPLKIRNKTRKPALAISIQHLSPCLRRKHEREVNRDTRCYPSCPLQLCCLFPLQINLTLLKSGAFTCLFNYFFRNQIQKISTFRENS